MPFKTSARLVLAAAVMLLCAAPAAPGQAQDPCAMPQLRPVSRETNMFTPEQATTLGDIVMRRISREFALVGDPALTRYMQDIADRMSEASGAGKVRVRIIDLPEVNASTFAGGHVVVARKLISFVRSEDELAGILAHEFGHVLRRDTERDYSTLMRSELGVTALGDAKDIEDKYNKLLENYSRKPVKFSNRETEEEQRVADQLAVWLMARVGYNPRAYADVWDRFNELKQNTGSWLSDLFGMTKPEAARLRVALRAAAALPAACSGPRQTTEPAFKAWQDSVLGASRSSRAESLTGVLTQAVLTPPLRSDLAHLKFSPDGKWVLAQDDDNIYVFARDASLTFKFRADAPGARPAWFTPDSSGLVFSDDNFRVERWSLASGTREWVRELVVTKPCIETGLSPDAAYLACVEFDGTAFTVGLHDVTTGKRIFEKFLPYSPSFEDGRYLPLFLPGPDGMAHFVHVRYSPDAKVLVVSRGSLSMAVDLARRAIIRLPGSIRDRIGYSFSFVGNDRIVGVHETREDESAIVSFPQGKVLTRIKIGRLRVDAPTRGDGFIMLRGVPRVAVAVVDTKLNKVTMTNALPGFDLYDDAFVSERGTGELALYRVGATTQPISTVTVPLGGLGRLRAVAIAPDFGAMAISGTSRGAVYDLKAGQQKMLVRGFRGAYLDGSVAYLDIPGDEQAERGIFRVDFAARTADVLLTLEPPLLPGQKPLAARKLRADNAVAGSGLAAVGPYVVGWKGRAKESDPAAMAVYDARTGAELWSRAFPKGQPAISTIEWRHNTLTFRYGYAADNAQPILEANPALETTFESMHAKRDDVGVIEVVDVATGNTRGFLLIDFANDSFRVGTVESVGDRVVVSDSNNRTLAYSLASGAQTGRAFGTPLAVSKDGTRVVIQNTSGEVTIHALPALEKVGELSFSSPVAFAQFSDDDKRLFVLTKDQQIYTLAVGAGTGGRD